MFASLLKPAATRQADAPVAAHAERTRVRTVVPAVDIHETASAVVLTADVPGAGKDDVAVTLDRGVLTVRAHARPLAEPADQRPLLREFDAVDYERRFELGEAVDAGRISATVAQGVLTVVLPKASAPAPRSIAVQAG